MKSILFCKEFFQFYGWAFSLETTFYLRILCENDELFNQFILNLKFIHFLVIFIEEYPSKYYSAIDYLC